MAQLEEAYSKEKEKEKFLRSLKQLVESRKPMTSKPDLSMEELAMIMALWRPQGVTAIELQKMIIRKSRSVNDILIA